MFENIDLDASKRVKTLYIIHHDYARKRTLFKRSA